MLKTSLNMVTIFSMRDEIKDKINEHLRSHGKYLKKNMQMSDAIICVPHLHNISFIT